MNIWKKSVALSVISIYIFDKTVSFSIIKCDSNNEKVEVLVTMTLF